MKKKSHLYNTKVLEGSFIHDSHAYLDVDGQPKEDLLWTERECLVSREEIKIYLVLFNNFAFLSSFTQKHMTFHLVKKCLVFL